MELAEDLKVMPDRVAMGLLLVRLEVLMQRMLLLVVAHLKKQVLMRVVTLVVLAETVSAVLSFLNRMLLFLLPLELAGLVAMVLEAPPEAMAVVAAAAAEWARLEMAVMVVWLVLVVVVVVAQLQVHNREETVVMVELETYMYFPLFLPTLECLVDKVEEVLEVLEKVEIPMEHLVTVVQVVQELIHLSRVKATVQEVMELMGVGLLATIIRMPEVVVKAATAAERQVFV